METLNNSQDNKKSKARNVPFISVLLVVAVLGLAVALLVATGRLAVSLKSPNETVVLREEACGTDTIEQYNEILGEQGIDVEGLVGFSQQLLEEHGDSSDPNCLFMIAQGFAFAGETSKSAEVFERLATLEKSNGIYASGQIDSLSSLRDLSVIADPEDFELSEEGSW